MKALEVYQQLTNKDTIRPAEIKKLYKKFVKADKDKSGSHAVFSREECDIWFRVSAAFL